MFKILVLIVVEKKYIKCNIWRVAVRLSYIQKARFLNVDCCYSALFTISTCLFVPSSCSLQSPLLFISFPIQYRYEEKPNFQFLKFYPR
jgi:hypothetical protein